MAGRIPWFEDDVTSDPFRFFYRDGLNRRREMRIEPPDGTQPFLRHRIFESERFAQRRRLPEMDISIAFAMKSAISPNIQPSR
jgi:hypothetical protein